MIPRVLNGPKGFLKWWYCIAVHLLPSKYYVYCVTVTFVELSHAQKIIPTYTYQIISNNHPGEWRLYYFFFDVKVVDLKPAHVLKTMVFTLCACEQTMWKANAIYAEHRCGLRPVQRLVTRTVFLLFDFWCRIRSKVTVVGAGPIIENTLIWPVYKHSLKLVERSSWKSRTREVK